ncbi:helix-hairpin-helix domain-containing protein [Streptococcaceae bacterium ESL0687]|nr:helix-hairpin-helix domain-containing protein [Streptococcaceae bacterium ESL0687]
MELKNYLQNLRKKRYFIPLVIASGLLFLGFFAYFLISPSKKSDFESKDGYNLSGKIEQFEQDSDGDDLVGEDGDGFLVVDVKGEVVNPGIYKLASNARVDDALKLAGGLNKEADSKSVNLAQKLTDEMVVYVAKVGEASTSFENLQNQPTDNNDKQESTKVNINTADLGELQKLPGVGLKKAQDIIDYRKENGNFKSIEDLQKVGGFGAKSLEKLKDSIFIK